MKKIEEYKGEVLAEKYNGFGKSIAISILLTVDAIILFYLAFGFDETDEELVAFPCFFGIMFALAAILVPILVYINQSHKPKNVVIYNVEEDAFYIFTYEYKYEKINRKDIATVDMELDYWRRRSYLEGINGYLVFKCYNGDYISTIKVINLDECEKNIIELLASKRGGR